MKFSQDMCLSFLDLFRFQVALYYIKEKKIECGGSVINPGVVNVKNLFVLINPLKRKYKGVEHFQ